MNIFIVLLGWIAILFVNIAGLFVSVKCIHGDYATQTYQQRLWLPKTYIQGNKLPDGSYAPVSSVSINDTAILMPFGNAFKKLADSTSDNKIIVVTGAYSSVSYVTKANGMTYYAAVVPVHTTLTHQIGAHIIDDDDIEWQMVPDTFGNVFSVIISWLILGVVFFMPIRALCKRTRAQSDERLLIAMQYR